MSYAYREWLGIEIPLAPVIGDRFPLDTNSEIPLLKASSAIQNKRGERGSPCLIPLFQEKKPTNLPLTQKDSLADIKITLIHPQNLSSKPKAASTLRKILQSIVSKAFLMSNLMAMFPPKVLKLRRLTASEAIQILSEMFLPLINPLYCSDTILGAMVANLSAKTLEINLKWKLARAIGLKSSILSAPLCLGMSTTELELRLGKSQPCLKN